MDDKEGGERSRLARRFSRKLLNSLHMWIIRALVSVLSSEFWVSECPRVISRANGVPVPGVRGMGPRRRYQHLKISWLWKRTGEMLSPLGRTTIATVFSLHLFTYIYIYLLTSICVSHNVSVSWLDDRWIYNLLLAHHLDSLTSRVLFLLVL